MEWLPGLFLLIAHVRDFCKGIKCFYFFIIKIKVLLLNTKKTNLVLKLINFSLILDIN
jgi:hypothetical protein